MQRWPTLAIVLAMLLFALWAIPLLRHRQQGIRASGCLTNVSLLVMASFEYSADYDGRFPIASAYPAALLLNPRVRRDDLICPADRRHSMPGYAYSRVWAGKKQSGIEDPACAVLLYDAVGDQPDYRHFDRHTRFCNADVGPGLILGYCDGHVHDAGMRSFTMQNVLTGRDSDYFHGQLAKPPTGEH